MLMDGSIISLTEAGHLETTTGQVQSPEEHLPKNMFVIKLYTILLYSKMCCIFQKQNTSSNGSNAVLIIFYILGNTVFQRCK